MWVCAEELPGLCFVPCLQHLSPIRARAGDWACGSPLAEWLQGWGSRWLLCPFLPPYSSPSPSCSPSPWSCSVPAGSAGSVTSRTRCVAVAPAPCGLASLHNLSSAIGRLNALLSQMFINQLLFLVGSDQSGRQEVKSGHGFLEQSPQASGNRDKDRDRACSKKHQAHAPAWLSSGVSLPPARWWQKGAGLCMVA